MNNKTRWKYSCSTNIISWITNFVAKQIRKYLEREDNRIIKLDFIIFHRLWRNVYKSIIVKKKKKKRRILSCVSIRISLLTLNARDLFNRLFHIGSQYRLISLGDHRCGREYNNVIRTESLIIRLCSHSFDSSSVDIYYSRAIFLFQSANFRMLLESKSICLVGGREIAVSVGAVHDIGYQQDCKHVPTPVR